jgi:hypothetical protein
MKCHQPHLASSALYLCHLPRLPPPAAACACHQLRLLLVLPLLLRFHCGLHKPSNRQEVDIAAHTSPPFSGAFVPWGRGRGAALMKRCSELWTKQERGRSTFCEAEELQLRSQLRVPFWLQVRDFFTQGREAEELQLRSQLRVPPRFAPIT